MSASTDDAALLEAQLSLDLRGSLDRIEPDGRVSGWCWSPDEPRVRRSVTVLVDGRGAIETVADILRGDLLAAGIGDGGHGLAADIPATLREAGGTAAIRLRDVATGRTVGAELPVTWTAAAHPALPLAGNVDLVTRDGWVSGWCWDPADPDRHVLLDVFVDDRVAGSVEACETRPDLRHASVGDGRYGFTVMLPYELLADRGTVQVRIAERGTGRTLGEPAMLRMGRRTEQDRRLAELERLVTLMRGRLEEVAREHEPQPEAEARTARRLFATVATFFQDLADGTPAAALAAGLRGGVGPTLAELRRTLPALTLRTPAVGSDGRPLVTLAVPATASVEQVHACLSALHDAGSDRLADIVLLDPSGLDPRCALLPALVANLRVGPAAEGAVAAFAQLLQGADTRLVGLVSPRVRAEPGWLETLAATLDEAPDAGLVGAAVIRADGLLQHAGLVLDADDRFRDLGHLAPPDLPQHRFLRPVDATAPLALLADRRRVAEAGGLQAGYQDFAPAIAELCLAMRSAGQAVLLQPAATAIWAAADGDPQPAGTDVEDQRRLQLCLLRHRRDARAASGFVGHALVVDAELPVPDRDAGSVAALEQMLVLRRLGWRVTFAATGGALAAEADRRRLERAGIEVEAWSAERGVTDILRERGRDLQLVHLYRHRIAALLLPRVRELAPAARVVFSPADLHFLREAREAELLGEASMVSQTRAQELACARDADATLVLSDHEYRLLAAEVAPDKLHLLRWIARPSATVPSFLGRNGLLFVGHFRHSPNVDAMLWWARDVAPVLARLRPGLVLDVVGADAPPAIQSLHSETLRVRGWIADLGPVLGGTRLCIAPLRYGAGFKGKVATSLAAGVPLVGTPVALEGTGLADGDGVMTAATAEAFARAVVQIHDDEAAWNELSGRARERVATLYAPARADDIFRGLLARLGLPAR